MINDMKFYGTATVGAKGQIVIPAEARENLGLKEGEKLIIASGPHQKALLVIKTEMFNDMISKMTDLKSEIEVIATKLKADKNNQEGK